MKPLFKHLLVFTLILLASAFLSPLLFRILPFKFERIFNRLVMIFSLIYLVSESARSGKLRLRSFRDGWEWLRYYFQSVFSSPLFIKGFLLGFLILALVTGLRLGFGKAAWSVQDFTVWDWGWTLLRCFLTGFLIGTIEEFFFRQFVFQTLHRTWRWNLAASLAVTNVFYSALHFVNAKKIWVGPEPNFGDGLRLIGAPFLSLADWQPIWMAAVGLLLFGLILNMLVVRTGSLFPAIGLHAGCVFYIKLDGDLVDFFNAVPAWLWGSNKVYDGLLGWAFLILLGAAAWWVIPYRGKRT